jgi:hypothetical protein
VYRAMFPERSGPVVMGLQKDQLVPWIGDF